MKAGWRDRIGYWLERFDWLELWLFTDCGTTPKGQRMAQNRINGHLRIGGGE